MIQAELGDGSDLPQEIEEYTKRIAELRLPRIQKPGCRKKCCGFQSSHSVPPKPP